MRNGSLTAACAAGLLALGTVVVTSNAAAQESEKSSCVSCHEILGGQLADPVTRFATDVHASKGLGCEDCHGGDAEDPGLEAMDPAKGFLGRPGSLEIPQFCGRCHSSADFMKRYNPSLRVDQVTEYVTSVHGKRLTELADSNVATCISCHPAHTIRPQSDPLSTVHPLRVAQTCGACHADTERMRPYAIPTDQLSGYEQSVHWKQLSVEGDLSAPTCNDCHGNHGAAPPGIAWVGNVCGQCHVVMAEQFARSAHAEMFTMLGAPGCATCHGNHEIRQASDTMLGLGEGAVCANCHVADVGGGVAAVAMRGLIDSLRDGVDAADSLLLLAERAGMEVSQAQFDLQAARNTLIQARAAVHSFVVDSVEAHVSEGLKIAAEAHVKGERALREIRFRRTGLTISAIIILGLIVGIVLKIRQIEPRTSRAG
jgi:hypothetical protein